MECVAVLYETRIQLTGKPSKHPSAPVDRDRKAIFNGSYTDKSGEINTNINLPPELNYGDVDMDSFFIRTNSTESTLEIHVKDICYIDVTTSYYEDDGTVDSECDRWVFDKTSSKWIVNNSAK